MFPDKFGTPRQPGLVPEAVGLIEIFPQWQPEQSLEGLSAFSHLWVIFHFHLNRISHFHAKVHPPRLGGNKQGVFATRSPHRPNSMGLSLVQILKVNSNSILVAGIDLVDGTPVLDIKPYLPEVESVPQALSGWVGALPQKLPSWSFEWDHQAQDQLAQWYRSENLKKILSGFGVEYATPDKLREMIEKILMLDPRPVVYRGYEGVDSPYRDQHAVRVYNGDIHFRFVDESRLKIENILF